MSSPLLHPLLHQAAAAATSGQQHPPGALYVVATPIGNLPTPDALDLSGLNLPAEDVEALLSVDTEGWKKEVADIEASYQKFGSHLPAALKNQLNELRKRLG